MACHLRVTNKNKTVPAGTVLFLFVRQLVSDLKRHNRSYRLQCWR